MNHYDRHRIDHANGHTRGRLKQRLDREISQSPHLAEDFRELKAQMKRYRERSEGRLEDAVLRRIVVGAERRLAQSKTGTIRWQPLVAAGAAAGLAVAALIKLNPIETPELRVAAPPRVQIALTRADGAIRLYLTLPVRTHRKETS